MTPQELDAFYREVDHAERVLFEDVAAVQYAADAVACGLRVADADDLVRVYARVAFRFALRIARRAEREAEQLRRTRARRLSRHDRLQAAADAGFDTWDDYHGEK